MSCKWASLSIVALLENLEGVRLPGLLREKKRKEKKRSGFFLGPGRHYDFKSAGHLKLW
jgi:hypothetical protein